MPLFHEKMALSVTVLLFLSITTAHGWGFMPFHPMMMMMGMHSPWAAYWYGANRWGSTANPYGYAAYPNNAGAPSQNYALGKTYFPNANNYQKTYPGYNQPGFTNGWYGNTDKYGFDNNKWGNGYDNDKWGYGYGNDKWGYGHGAANWGYGNDKWGYGYDNDNWGYGYGNDKTGKLIYGHGNNKYNHGKWDYGYGNEKYGYGNDNWGYGYNNENWGYGHGTDKFGHGKWAHGYGNNKYSNGKWGYGDGNDNWGYGHKNGNWGNDYDKWGYDYDDGKWNYGNNKFEQSGPHLGWHGNMKHGADRYDHVHSKKGSASNKWILNNYDFEGHWNQNDEHGRPDFGKRKHAKYHVTKMDKFREYNPYDKYNMIGAYNRGVDTYGYDKDGYGFRWFVH